jgi:transcriptional regulator with XRE-family HTH domain
MARTNTPRAHALGAALREHREAACLTIRKLGSLLDRHHTAITRWENGRIAPSVADTSAVLGILGVTGPERDRLLELARDAADPNWVAPGVHRHLAALTEYERTASRVTNVQFAMIPGVLQTADYARSIMLSAGATRGEAEQRVTYRMGRRDILTRHNPVEFHAVIGEAALRYPPCDRLVMLEQLRHLQKVSDMDNVTVQALPLTHGYSPALEGPFVLIEFDRARPVVQLEHYRSATTLTDQGDVRDYQDAADNLRRGAMSPAATEGLIAEVADEMEHTT